MPENKKSAPSEKKIISIHGNVTGNDVIIGDNNTVNKTTIIQKFFNIFKSDAETLEQRNRRILLGHVENAWIKGVLDASLYGAAMLDLGIKETPEAIINKYPWTLKKESTDETLPAGTSMLEIFDSIGMGRSLLILGAPGSGKTTMLLELARGLIARAREDITQPIPMVFNLASWTEKLTLTDWLAQELNNLYSVPRKTAPDWVKGNKLLLLLDGLDEVRQESRAKCVEAINVFRKQHGLTSLAVCSRSQDYADLNAKLSFEGAIEVQPLTQEKIAEFFNRFGDEMAGIKQALEKDSALREMAETPLFLSIMIMAYWDKKNAEIFVFQDQKVQRIHLLNAYIRSMFDHKSTDKINYSKNDTKKWLSRLASYMVEENSIPFLIENIQPNWIDRKHSFIYRGLSILFGIAIYTPVSGIVFACTALFLIILTRSYLTQIILPFLNAGMFFGFVGGFFWGWMSGSRKKIEMIDVLIWDFRGAAKTALINFIVMFVSVIIMLVVSILFLDNTIQNVQENWRSILVLIILTWFAFVYFTLPFDALSVKHIKKPTKSGELLSLTIKNSLKVIPYYSIVYGLIFTPIFWLGSTILDPHKWASMIPEWFGSGLLFGQIIGIFSSWKFGGNSVIKHFALRTYLKINNLLPWRLVPFLDHCVDLIFLRRVGGGYIFVHRLLMEHFAEMYVETPTSKGN